jgi:hypothetical protein
MTFEADKPIKGESADRCHDEIEKLVLGRQTLASRTVKRVFSEFVSEFGGKLPWIHPILRGEPNGIG